MGTPFCYAVRMRGAGRIAGVGLVFACGVFAMRTVGVQGAGPTVHRITKTVRLSGYVCTNAKPTIVLWESRYCVLSSTPLPVRPTDMSYIWQSPQSNVWWSGDSLAPTDVAFKPQLRSRVFLAWA